MTQATTKTSNAITLEFSTIPWSIKYVRAHFHHSRHPLAEMHPIHVYLDQS
jgi:hypothetical protein